MAQDWRGREVKEDSYKLYEATKAMMAAFADQSDLSPSKRAAIAPMLQVSKATADMFAPTEIYEWPLTLFPETLPAEVEAKVEINPEQRKLQAEWNAFVQLWNSAHKPVTA